MLLPNYSTSMAQASPSNVKFSLFESSIERDESAWLASFTNSLTVPCSCHRAQSYDDVANYRTIHFHSASSESS